MSGVRPEVESSRGAQAAVFVISATSMLYFTVGAQLYVSEMLLVVVALMAVLNRAKPLVLTAAFVTLAIWLFGTFLSDLIAGTEGLDALKGLLRVAFTGVNIFALAFLTRNSLKTITAMWWGVVFAQLSSFLFYPNAYAIGEPWKFGLGIPVTVVLGLLMSRWRPNSLLVILGFLSIAVVHFILGFRSLAVICAATAILFVLRRGIAASELSRFRAGLRLVVISCISIAVLVASTIGYDVLAKSGTFGASARIKADYLSGAYGSLLAGRPEIFSSIQTILANPFSGTGSYGTPDSTTLEASANFFDGLGYTSISSRLVDQGEASFHSELFGAAAENGLLALPFWLVVLGLLIRGAADVVRRRAAFPELVGFLVVLGLWDLFFSPYGADRRFWLAATIVTLCRVSSRSKGQDAIDSHNQLQPRQISAAVR